MFMNRKEPMSVEITNDLKILVKRSVQFDINQSNSPNYQSIKVIGVPVLIISLQLPQQTNFFFRSFSSHSAHDKQRAHVHNEIEKSCRLQNHECFSCLNSLTIDATRCRKIEIFSEVFVPCLFLFLFLNVFRCKHTQQSQPQSQSKENQMNNASIVLHIQLPLDSVLNFSE